MQLPKNTYAPVPIQGILLLNRTESSENYDGVLATGFSQLARSSMSQQKESYSFSGRVLLTAVVVLAILTVAFVLIRLLLFQCLVRGSGSLAAGVRRSFSNFGRSSRHGLDAAGLAALPVTAYRKDDAGSASTSAAAATDCAVCLSELADGEKVRALPACRHVFHVDCVDAWLRTRTTCPVCRAEVAPQPKDAEAARPAVFGAGGTLVVTVQGGVAQTRDARTPAMGYSGQPAGAAGLVRTSQM